jgi:hypothetical protein
MNININIVELASELACDKLHDNWENSIKIYKDDLSDCLEYTEEAQEIFNDLYDQFYSMIDNLKN